MDHSHGISGVRIPTLSARRVLATGLALLCALVQTAAQGDEPAGPRILPAVVEQSVTSELPTAAESTSRRLPPIEATLPAVTTAGYSEVMTATDPYTGQQISYVTQPPSPDESNPLSSMNPNSNAPLIKLTGMQPPEVTPSEEEKAAESEGDHKTPDGQQVYGKAPTNNNLQFLRDIDVLLAPGAWQADTGFVYTHFSNHFPILIRNGADEIIGAQDAEIRRRLLYTPLAFRYGVSTNVQFYSFLPVGFSNTQTSTLGISETQNVSGLGDLNMGVSVHLLDGEDQMPDVIATVGFTAPTGKFSSPLFGLVPGSNLGQGFWAYNAQLLCINRYDPVIVFYGAGYRHLWERSFDGQLYAPGEQINYMLGVGFSINDRVTLSSTFQGFYITNTSVNNESVRGSNLEPLSMRFAATIVRDCRIIEPFVQIGVTQSAPQANLGVVVTFY